MSSRFAVFRYDLFNLSRYKFSVKYSLPFTMYLVAILIVGQVLTEFFSIRQLDRAIGKITAIQKIKGEQDKQDTDKVNFSLRLELSNSDGFVIENYEYARKLNSELKKGDSVTIYHPPVVFKILSAGFAFNVNQLEHNNSVLLSFGSQQQDTWFIIAFLLLALLLFYGFYRYLLTQPLYNPYTGN